MRRGVLIMAAALLLAAGTARAQERAREPELNEPGSWAYEGCQRALLAKVKKDRPLVTAIEITGRVERERQSGRESVLKGEARFEREGDKKHVTFECTVDRDAKKILGVDYDKR